MRGYRFMYIILFFITGVIPIDQYGKHGRTPSTTRPPVVCPVRNEIDFRVHRMYGSRIVLSCRIICTIMYGTIRGMAGRDSELLVLLQLPVIVSENRRFYVRFPRTQGKIYILPSSRIVCAAVQ